MGWLKMQAVELGLSFVVAPLAAIVMQFLKQLVGIVERLPAWQKRGVVVFLAAIFTALGNVLGVDFGVTSESVSALGELGQDTVKVVVASALAFALHWAKKQSGK